jgi:hypothetical protein
MEKVEIIESEKEGLGENVIEIEIVKENIIVEVERKKKKKKKSKKLKE